MLYPGNGGGGNLYTVDEYKDFVFRFDFMLTEGANNGIGSGPRSKAMPLMSAWIQVLDNESRFTASSRNTSITVRCTALFRPNAVS